MLLPQSRLGLYRRYTPPMPTSGYIYPGTYGHHTGPVAGPHNRGFASRFAREFIFELVLQLILELFRSTEHGCTGRHPYTTSGTSNRLLHLGTRRSIPDQRGPLNHELAVVGPCRVAFW